MVKAFVALIPVVQDLEQSHDESIVMAILIKRSPLFYISNRLRVYVIPGYVVAASASLILSGRFTAQNFLLNGMAIGFASSIDDLLSFICLTGGAREEVEKKVEELLKQEDKERGWKRNRFYFGVLVLTLVAIVVFTEDLISVFGTEVNVGDGVTRMSCTDLGLVAVNSIQFTGFFVGLFMVAVNERNPGWLDKVKDTAMTLVIVGLGWWIIELLSYYLHFQVD